MTPAIVVLVTVGSEREAETIATALLEEGLAACVRGEGVNLPSPWRGGLGRGAFRRQRERST